MTSQNECNQLDCLSSIALEAHGINWRGHNYQEPVLKQAIEGPGLRGAEAVLNTHWT